MPTADEIAEEHEQEELELQTEIKRSHVPTHRRVFEKVALGIIAFAILLAGVIGALMYQTATRWDPLGDYPVQVAYAVVNGERQPPTRSPLIQQPNGSTFASVVLPTFYLDDKIRTTGIKCTETTSEVLVSGVLTWVSDLPPGQIIEVARGGGPRGPGCITYEFANPIPPVVLETIEELSKDGLMESEWHLTGTETPVKPDGTTGEPRTWTTTAFRVVHMERPDGR